MSILLTKVLGRYLQEEAEAGAGGAGGGAGGAGTTGGETTELSGTETAGGEGGSGTGEAGGEGGGAGAGEGGTGAGTPETTPEDKVKVRFSQITKERDEAVRRQRDADAKLQLALEALNKVNPTTVAPVKKETVVEDPEPTPPTFEDPEQYQRDMAVYTQKVTERTVKLQLAAAEANRKREETETAARNTQEQHKQAWATRRQKAIEETPDYVEVAEDPNLHISPAMAMAISTDDAGPKLAYHLGKNPELAERISKLPPQLQLMELGMLKVELNKPPKVPVSKATPPIKPLTGSSEPNLKSDDELSMEEYAAKRNARKK
jgi:hypothetical protein